MILRKFQVFVYLITLYLQVQNVFGSKSIRKDSSFHQSSSTQQQYKSPFMKPSKPDPHFEVLDEQRGYKNYYQSRLREGHEGNYEERPTKLTEVVRTSSKPSSKTSFRNTKKASRRKDKSLNRSTLSSRAGTPSLPLSSSASSVLGSYEGENDSQSEFTLGRKSRSSRENQQHHPKFSGSQLISGDAGMSESFKAEQSRVDLPQIQDGWKILMGPSILPDENDEIGINSIPSQDYGYTTNNNINNNDYYDSGFASKRSFTSLTDNEAKTRHRTITSLPQTRRQNSKSSSTPTKLKYSSIDDFSNLKKITGQIHKSSGSKGGRRRGSNTSSNKSSRAIQNVSIPKQSLQHKYAKVTRRNSSSSSNVKSKTRNKAGKSKSKSSERSKSKLSHVKTQYSFPIKSETYRRIHQKKPSPVMTLDTKKLVLEPVASASAEHNTIPMMVSSSLTPTFSSEHYSSGEPSMSKYYESRFDRLSHYPLRHDLDADDLITEEDDDQVNEDHQQEIGHFQTKTALNLGEIYTPLVTVSSSLSYPSTHHNEQGGFATAPASADELPDLHNPLDPENINLPPHYPTGPIEEIHQHHNHEIDNAIAEDDIIRSQPQTPSTVPPPPPPPPPPPQPHVEFIPPSPGHSHGRIMVGPLPPSRFNPSPISSSSLPLEPMQNISSSNGSPVVVAADSTNNDNSIDNSNNIPSSLPISFSPMMTYPQFRRIPLPLPNYVQYAASNPSYYRDYQKEFYQMLALSSLYHQHPTATFSVDPGNQHQPPMARDNLPGSTSIHSIPIPLPSHHLPLPQHQHINLPPPPPTLLPPPGTVHLRPTGLSPGRPIAIPFEVESGRKAPSAGDQRVPLYSPPPPPPGVDPDHPAIQHLLKNPQNLLRNGIFIDPSHSSSNIHETTKNYLQYNIHKDNLIPLDKRLVYLSMIFSWMFWITAFYTYYRYAVNGNKTNHFVLNVPQDGENPQVVSVRSIDGNNPWTFAKVLEYIEIAQKTYEGFDWQDLNCQKRNLCELVQKQNEPWGETGRKLANSYVYRVMDALDGIPIPQLIQTYLKEYKEALTNGKNPNKNCGEIYPQCKFSIKEVLNKSGKKKA